MEINTIEELGSYFGEDLVSDLQARVSQKGFKQTGADIEKSNGLLLKAYELEGADEETWFTAEIYKVVKLNDSRLEALEVLKTIK